MNWFGHVVRKDYTRLVNKVMEMGKSMKSRRGSLVCKEEKLSKILRNLQGIEKSGKKWVKGKQESYLKY